MKTTAPKILATPNHRNLAICVVGPNKLIFSSGRHFYLSLLAVQKVTTPWDLLGLREDIFIKLQSLPDTDPLVQRGHTEALTTEWTDQSSEVDLTNRHYRKMRTSPYLLLVHDC